MILDIILVVVCAGLYLLGMSLMSDYLPMIRQLLEANNSKKPSKWWELKLLLLWPYAVFTDVLRGLYGR